MAVPVLWAVMLLLSTQLLNRKHRLWVTVGFQPGENALFFLWITPYFGINWFNCYRGPFPGRKAVGASSWPLPSNTLESQLDFRREKMLYFPSESPLILGSIGSIAIGGLFLDVKRSKRQAWPLASNANVQRCYSIPTFNHTYILLDFCIIVLRHNCTVLSALEQIHILRHCYSLESFKVRVHSSNASLLGGFYRWTCQGSRQTLCWGITQWSLNTYWIIECR